MSRKHTVKYIHEGRYVAAVDVEFIRDETAWSPYLTLEDACKLDEARGALRYAACLSGNGEVEIPPL